MSYCFFQRSFNVSLVIRCYKALQRDPIARLRTIYSQAKNDVLEEYLPINCDLEEEVVERNKVLRKEYLQNIKTLHSMRNVLYPYRWKFIPSGMY